MHFVEFAYNNSAHFYTKPTPFFSNRGVHPHWTVLEHPEILNTPAMEDCLCRLQEIYVALSHYLNIAQASYEKFADHHRLDSSCMALTT